MITRDSKEFYSRMQRYVFIHPDFFDTLDDDRYAVVDVSDMTDIGTPCDGEDGIEYELYAILEPGEEFKL